MAHLHFPAVQCQGGYRRTRASYAGRRYLGKVTSGASPQSPRSCESCAAPDDDLEPVHRVYVSVDRHPTEGDGSGAFTVVDEVEHWCFPCRSVYPHEPA